jgi:selenide,water dikinase
VLVSAGTADDAGVYLTDDGRAIVLTLDFFTPVVDDPHDYGRIAAANSLSDVYAMGGRPIVALNIACFPDGELPNWILGKILAGGQEKASEAGVPTIGGHSVSDRELKYGLAVVGVIDPGKIVRNTGAEAGDVMVLTKPLGIGILTTAIKYERLSADEIARVTDVMTMLNRSASEAMLSAGAHSATDITGFGLAGHALEMAEGSGVTLKLKLADLPVLDGAEELAAAGIAPGGLGTNRNYFGRRIETSIREGDARLSLIYDPQTSGGLLIALSPESVESFGQAMSEAGMDWWTIGRVTPLGEDPLVIL